MIIVTNCAKFKKNKNDLFSLLWNNEKKLVPFLKNDDMPFITLLFIIKQNYATNIKVLFSINKIFRKYV